MIVSICGVRGSTPAPGPEFTRVGGHTSCLAIGHDGGPPVLVLDAGTGIRRLSGLLGGAAFRGAILLGHLHWDHTQGLPFCTAADHPDAEVDLYMPDQGDPIEVLSRVMSPPHFPVVPVQLRGRWTFHGLERGIHELEGFEVLALDIPHKGGRTFGFRVTEPTTNATLAYLSDHWPTSLGPGPDGLGERHDAALRLCRDADVVFHDSQYTAAELPARAHYGHAAIEYAVALCEAAGAKSLRLFHHDPNRTDDEVDAVVAALKDSSPVAVESAIETDVLTLRPGK